MASLLSIRNIVFLAFAALVSFLLLGQATPVEAVKGPKITNKVRPKLQPAVLPSLLPLLPSPERAQNTDSCNSRVLLG